jgi:hypothetical protein
MFEVETATCQATSSKQQAASGGGSGGGNLRTAKYENLKLKISTVNFVLSNLRGPSAGDSSVLTQHTTPLAC